MCREGKLLVLQLNLTDVPNRAVSPSPTAFWVGAETQGPAHRLEDSTPAAHALWPVVLAGWVVVRPLTSRQIPGQTAPTATQGQL